MVKFSVPDYAIDITVVEQAAKNDAIIVMPYALYRDLIDDGYMDYIESTGLTYTNGEKIQVIPWSAKFIFSDRNFVLVQPDSILLEMLNVDDTKVKVITVDNNQI